MTGTSRGVQEPGPLLEVDDLDLFLPTPKHRPRQDPLLRALASPQSAEALARQTEIPVDDIVVRLIELESEGKLESLGSGMFVLRR